MSRFQAARSLVHSAFNSNRNENRPKKPPPGKGNRTPAEPKRKPPAHENPEQSAGRKEMRMARAVVPCLFELSSCAVVCPRSPSERQHPRKSHTRGRPEGYSIVPGGNSNKKQAPWGRNPYSGVPSNSLKRILRIQKCVYWARQLLIFLYLLSPSAHARSAAVTQITSTVLPFPCVDAATRRAITVQRRL